MNRRAPVSSPSVGRTDEHLKYWQDRAFPGPDAGAALRLRTGKLVEVARERRRLQVPAPVWSKLRHVCRDSEQACFVAVLACVHYVLARYADGRPVVTRVAGLLEQTQAVACLLVREVLDDESFADLLERTRAGLAGAVAHSPLPDDAIREALGKTDEAVFPSVEVRPSSGDDTSPPFDGMRFVVSLADGMLAVDFPPAVYSAVLAAEALGAIGRLLDFGLADPRGSLREFEHLSAELRVSRYSESLRDYPTTETLTSRLEHCFDRFPDRVAVSDRGETWSYAELRERAGGVAAQLRAAGVQPGDIVAIASQRHALLVAAIVGVLQCGAAYAPLDPDSPPERLEFILRDSGASVVLADGAVQLPAFDGTILLLEECGREVFAPADVRASELAYVIYTSGTTGRPKGVMVEHRNVVQLLLAEGSQFTFSEHDRWSLFHSQAFDLSVWEIFGALLFGGAVVVVPAEVTRDPEALFRLLVREQVTVVTQTPSAFYGFARAVLSAGDRRDWQVRYIVFGGEKLEPRLLKNFKANYPQTKLVNMYGITETTVHSTYREIVESDFDRDISPIGVALPALRRYIVDRNLRLLPPGAPGELLVGGAGVTRGYLGRRELTAQRFLNDPWAPGDRVYRSGDRVVLHDGGELEYLGRNDSQLKIRGYRVEPGEVEAALLKVSGVGRALVTAVEAGDVKSLCAYLEGFDGDPAEVRRLLAASLPEYMVPAFVIGVAQFPLTVNGKVDVRAMPNPHEVDVGVAHVAGDSTTARLADCFSKALGVRGIPHTTSFFALGGDSIKALRLVMLVNEEFGTNLSIKDVYAASSIAGIRELLPSRVGGKGSAQVLAEGRAQLLTLQQELEADETLRELLPVGYVSLCPLTDIERGMIYSSLVRPHEPVYYEQFVYRIHISDLAATRAALETMVERHEILRSRYYATGLGRELRAVMRAIELPLEVIDLRGKSEAEQAACIDESRTAALNIRYRFNGEIPWQMRLYLLADTDTGSECFMVWSFHHCMLDGWSISVFIQELSQLLSGRELTETRLRSNYSDYFALSSKRANEEVVRNYWKQYLAGYERNRLPFNYAGSSISEASGTRILVRSLDPLAGELEQVSRRLRVSRKAVCLAAHVWLLHALGHEREIVTGVVSNDRPELPDADRVLGCFLVTVPFRVAVDSCASNDELIERCEDYLLDVRQYETSLARVAAAIGETSSGANPVFDTLFNYQDFHILDEWGPNSRLAFDTTAAFRTAVLTDNREMTNTAFDVEVNRTLGQFHAKVKYSPAFIDDSEAESALALYERALTQLVRHPSDRPLRHALVLGTEVSALVHDWNGQRVPWNRDRGLHELFESMALRQPERIAVIHGEVRCTYRELDAQANRLARSILRHGVEPGSLVGIRLERSVSMVAAMLAVLKAGCTYVPVDTEYPEERQRYILEHAGVRCVVTDRPSPAGTVCIDPRESQGEESSDLGVRSNGERLAYIIYTSGSTGRPKGVAIEHRAATNLVEAINDEFQIGSDDQLLFITSICFDLSVYDIFGTLAAGGTVRVAGLADIADAESLCRMVMGGGITVWNSVPSTFNHLVDVLGRQRPEVSSCALRRILLSGDWLSVPHVRKAAEYFPGAKLIALGGATECTVWSNFYDTADLGTERITVPYGRPLRNNRFYVLDSHQRPVPRGAPGELYIGGDGVARGYFGDADRTAASFFDDPFCSGGRMYRTGDLGRMLPDGNLEFLGRIDFQVKIRGYRVEPGEIEAHLNELEGVTGSVVVARRADSGNYLCAYVVSREELTLGQVRQYLSERVPHYMLPEALVALQQLPLTHNGKLDRAALPEPTLQRAPEPDASREVWTPTEQRLAMIVDQLIPDSNAGRDDSLFHLGVRSLEMASLASRVSEEFGVTLSLRDLFARPTLRDIAASVKSLQKVEAVSFVPSTVDRRIASHSQRRLWVLHELADRRECAYNLTGVYRLRSAERIALGDLESAFRCVVSRHEILRTIFALEGDELVQHRVDLEGAYQWKQLDLASDPSGVSRVDEIANAEARTPFDLERGPLLRLTVVQLATETALIICVHHIVCDGASIRVILDDVIAAYAALSRGAEPNLPPVVSRYDEYALKQRRALEEGHLDNARSFWLDKLKAPLALAEFASDLPRSPSRTKETATLCVEFGEATTRKLQALADADGASMFSCLLSLLCVLLHRHTSESDIIVGVPVAGRDHTSEGQVGLYLNMLPMRVSLNSSDSFRDVLRLVKETVLEALDYGEYPFDLLVDELALPRDPARAPLFSVTATEENVSEDDVSLAAKSLGWDLSAKTVTGPVARFDLSFHFQLGTSTLIRLEYDASLFGTETVEGLLAQMQQLALGAVADVERTLSDLPLMTPEQRNRLVRDLCSGEDVVWDKEATLVQMVRHRARQRPEAIAIVANGERTTYEELDACSGAVAKALCELGAVRGGPVLIVADRSPESLVGILGILKAGCAYVPVSAEDPTARQQTIAENAGARICVVPPGHSAVSGTQPLHVDLTQRDLEFGVQPSASDTAYIIYTSGTTGVPKGVVVSHRNAVHFVSWMSANYSISEADIVLQRSPLVFDASIAEVFLTWGMGGTLVVAAGADGFEPSALTRLIRDEGITVAQFVPSVLQLFVDHLDGIDRSDVRSLRLVLAAGEILRPETVARFHALVNCRLDNCYGPTEATVNASSYRTRKGDQVIAIGRPAPGSAIYIVDEKLELVPPGVVGELLIGGESVTQGYLGQAELTADKFIRVEWLPGERLYRTGDYGRYDREKNLRFLGRRDGQLKVRGFRIEVADVENAISTHPGVGEVAVCSREVSRENELVAYYVARKQVDPQELRAFCARLLPHYMVPGHFVQLEELPRSRTGKLERSKLPEVRLARGDATVERPVTALEQRIAAIWARVLGVGEDELSVNDNFFEVGGNSLRFLTMFATTSDDLEVNIDIVDAFQTPTIRGIASIVERTTGATGGNMGTAAARKGYEV